MTLILHELVTDEIVDRQLDGLLRRHTDELNGQALVEAKEALVTNDFLEAIPTVSVHDFANVGFGSLVLHSRLDQIDGVDSERANCSGDRSQKETVAAFESLHANITEIGRAHV